MLEMSPKRNAYYRGGVLSVISAETPLKHDTVCSSTRCSQVGQVFT